MSNNHENIRQHLVGHKTFLEDNVLAHNSNQIKDHNSHTVRDTFVHTINRGVAETVTVTLTGGLGVAWTAGEIYDNSTNAFISVDAGSGNLTNTSLNYLKWVSGTTLTLSTSASTGDEILVSRFSVYDGNINGHREVSLIDESVANARRALRAVMPNRITSGMSVHEDTDATNPLDVTMDAGVLWKDILERMAPVEIKSRNTAMVRHFHTTSVWDSDTNAQIETTNYDNGADLTAIPANKWVKAVFIYMSNKIGWVYPNAYYTTEAQALDAPLPSLPTGMTDAPKLTAIVYKQGHTTFANVTWQDVRPGISTESFNSVTDHDSLTNLAWTSSGHTGTVSTFAGFDGSGVTTNYTESDYVLVGGSRPMTANWDMGNFTLTANGLTIDGTFTDGTASIVGGAISGATNTNWDDSYSKRVDTWGDGLEWTAQTAKIDHNATNLKITATELNTIQDIASTASPTFVGATFSGAISGITTLGCAAITTTGNFSQTGATTFSTGTGAISLNGITTVSSDFALTGGTNTYIFGTHMYNLYESFANDLHIDLNDDNNHGGLYVRSTGDGGSNYTNLFSINRDLGGVSVGLDLTMAANKNIVLSGTGTVTAIISATSSLANGVIATTQADDDNSTKVATTAYVDSMLSTEDFWDRSDDDLTPKTANDDIVPNTSGTLGVTGNRWTEIWGTTITGTTVTDGTASLNSGAITGSSFGGITSANLVDKTASEAITGSWNFNTDSGNQPFYISRIGGTAQTLAFSVGDQHLTETYTQDVDENTAHYWIRDLAITDWVSGDREHQFKINGTEIMMIDTSGIEVTGTGIFSSRVTLNSASYQQHLTIQRGAPGFHLTQSSTNALLEAVGTTDTFDIFAAAMTITTAGVLTIAGDATITGGTINFVDATFYLDKQADGSLRYTNTQGYIDIGPKNASWCHIYSDLDFYFNQDLNVNGKSRIYTTGNMIFTPATTGSKDIIAITPSASLLAASTWQGIDIATAALDPATGTACTIKGVMVNHSGLASTDENASVVGFQVIHPTSETSAAFYSYISELTTAKTQRMFYSYSNSVLSTTATYQGLYINWSGTTRDANAPVLQGLNVSLPVSYTNFGSSYAGYFGGSGRSVTICDASYALNITASGGSVSIDMNNTGILDCNEISIADGSSVNSLSEGVIFKGSTVGNYRLNIIDSTTKLELLINHASDGELELRNAGAGELNLDVYGDIVVRSKLSVGTTNSSGTIHTKGDSAFYIEATADTQAVAIGINAGDLVLYVNGFSNEGLRINDASPYSVTLAGDLIINGNDLTFGNGASIDNNSANYLDLNATYVKIQSQLFWTGNGIINCYNGAADSTLTINNSAAGKDVNVSMDGELTVSGGDTTYGTGTLPSLILGTNDTKCGAIKLWGNTAASPSYIQVSTNNLHIDSTSSLFLNYYSGGSVYFGTGASNYHSSITNTGVLTIGSTITATGNIRTNGIFNCAGTAGLTSSWKTVSDMQQGGVNVQWKERTITVKGGLVTSKGTESGWQST